MKRDMDLARKILLEIEAHPEPYEVGIKFEGITEKEIFYHIKLLYQAGLIEAREESEFGSSGWSVDCLTWAGHEFLDASRDETRWEKAKNLIFQKGGSLSFELLKITLSEIMKKTLFS
jgi:hypothetical protein